MGAPSSSIISEIFLQNIENTHLHGLARKHKLVNYFRFVDDILIIVDSQHTNINAILSDFHSIHPKLHFTKETEQKNTINYLYIAIHKKLTNVNISIFRKPTYTDTRTHCSISTATFRSPTVVSLLFLLQVFRILASGFTYSVNPRLRVFHETPTMQVANSQHATTIEHSSRCPRERQSSVVAYLERQGSVVAFFLVAFNSSGNTMVAHIWKLFRSAKNACGVCRKCPSFLTGVGW